MEIIIQGHKIDTKEIYAIEDNCDTRKCEIIIKLIDKTSIVISKRIPYETSSGSFRDYWAPYEKLYKEIKEKWESDKLDIPVFTLGN